MKTIEQLKQTPLVICDIDNTLVEKHHDMSERAIAAYHGLKKKGILFGLASGRGIKQLRALADRWHLRCDLIIGMNGSELYDGILNQSEVFYDMKAQWLKECFAIMAPFSTKPHLVRDGVFYVRANDETVRSSSAYAKNGTDTCFVEDDTQFWAGDAPKVGFRVRAEDMEQIEAHVAKFPSPHYIGFKTENTMFEFCNIHASKGRLLRVFCERHQIDLQTVCAFGDMSNDVSMLQEAGYGICMRNGSPDAKEAATWITEKSVTEDGWADFVERYLL